MNREKLVLAAGCAAFLAAVATAQTPPVPPPPAPAFKNLQVFPKNIARADLIANMKLFAQSLGVRCTHCHLGTEGQPMSTFDFASDARPAKATARKMLVMVHRINSQDFGVTDFANVKVTCFTCHRGSLHPATVPPPVIVPTAPANPPAQPKASERG